MNYERLKVAENRRKTRLKEALLTWMTPSIMLTILFTIAMTLCVLSDGDMSGRYDGDSTKRQAMYRT